MKTSIISSLFKKLLGIRQIYWVFLGFTISYCFFFIYPIFLKQPQMQFPIYIPRGEVIGMDLTDILSMTRSWLDNNQIIGPYPPLFLLFFTPFTLVSFSWAYRILSLITLLSFASSIFVFPLLLSSKKRISPILILILITGVISYGLQFELERGQFNVIAVFLCFLSIWIFHSHPKFSILAFILFTISVQLKIYPLIFIVLFINNWRDWKRNLKTLTFISLANLVSLFVLGPKGFISFVTSIVEFSKNHQVWWVNHSVYSFIEWFNKISIENGYRFFGQIKNIAMLQKTILILVIILFLLILMRSYQRNLKGINPVLVIGCIISALLIPAVSHDYTLALLPGPVAIFLGSDEYWDESGTPFLRILTIVLLTSFSTLYASTLFSYATKPLLLQNNFISLFLMLVIITILTFVTKTRSATSDLHPPVELEI